MDKGLKKKMKDLWKQRQLDKLESAPLEVLLMDSNQKCWKTRRGSVNYSAKIEGTKLYLTRDKGSRESYGGRTLLGRHFLEKKKWQDLVTKNFGSEIRDEIADILKSEYGRCFTREINMQLRENYPYDEAIRDLRMFFDKHVKHPEVRIELDKILDACFEEKTVAMRGIHEMFICYLKKYQLNEPYTKEEEKMIDELLQFWA